MQSWYISAEALFSTLYNALWVQMNLDYEGKGKCDFCVHFEKESVSLEEVNCNNGGKCLSRYVDGFKVGCKKLF